MAIYVFRCRNCDTQFEQALLVPDPQCCTEPMPRRDYRAEGVGFAVAGLKATREHNGTSGMRELFLETAEEAAGPGDPDGAKAIDDWNERFEPAEGNKKPLRPERPLHSRKVL